MRLRKGILAKCFSVLFFLIFSTVCSVPTGWTDVGPVSIKDSQGKSQEETAPKSAPVISAAPIVPSIREAAAESSEEESGDLPWFDREWFERIQKGLTYDNIEVHPRLRTEYVLDSNILLEPRDRRMDSIFREVPGVQVVVPFQDHYFKADYEAEFEQFVKTPRENAENQYFTSELGLNFTDLYVHVDESLIHTSSRSGTTFTERVPRLEETVKPLIGYRFNRFTTETSYQYFYRRFNTSAQRHLNYGAHEWRGALFMDLTAKTKMFAEYAFTDYNYLHERVRDSHGHEIFGGLKGELFPKTTLYSKFGYERLHYERSDDSNNFVLEVGANYRPLAKTVIDLGWTRSTEQSVFGTTDFFTQDQIFGRVSQRFTSKILGEGRIAYSNQDYDSVSATGAGTFTGERNDDLLTADAKLSYALNDWVSAYIQYQYNRRDSNASVFDYTDNVMTVGLAAKA